MIIVNSGIAGHRTAGLGDHAGAVAHDLVDGQRAQDDEGRPARTRSWCVTGCRPRHVRAGWSPAAKGDHDGPDEWEEVRPDVRDDLRDGRVAVGRERVGIDADSLMATYTEMPIITNTSATASCLPRSPSGFRRDPATVPCSATVMSRATGSATSCARSTIPVIHDLAGDTREQYENVSLGSTERQ